MTKKRRGWKLVQGKQLDPNDGPSITWALSREQALKDGIDVDAIRLQDFPVILHPARVRPSRRRRRTATSVRRKSPARRRR